MRATIQQQLVETGHREKLKDHLRARLVEIGWRDKLKEHCKEVIRNKGVQKITVEEIVKEVLQFGRASVPDEVKADLLHRLKKFMSLHASGERT